MGYTAIFFDLDDTLVDTVQNNKEALQDIYTDYRFMEYFDAYEDFYQVFQSININLWDLYAHGRISKDKLKKERFKNTLKGFKELTEEESLQMNDDFLKKVNTKKNIIDGVKDTLDYLYPKYEMFILSNGFEEVQDHKMKNANLNPYFKKVILSDHIGVNKPHPLIFDYALEKAQVDRTNVVMVGDNIDTDILGAKNSSIDQIWYNPQNVLDKGCVKPTFTIKKLSDLKDIL